MAEDRARWMADLLAASIQVSGLSEEELERRLGWRPGSVGRILEREEDLDPDEALRVLLELNGGSDPERGPATADSERGHTQVVTDLLERFVRLGYEAREVDAPAEELDPTHLEKQVQEVLKEAFGEKKRGR